MMSWLTNNVGTILLILILAGIVTSVILNLIKDRKQGKSSCGCNCAHCAMAGRCHRNPNVSKK